MPRGSAGIVLALLVSGSVLAGVPPASNFAPGTQAMQARVLGKKAVMHVYHYAPETLEITSVTSQFFKDVDACESAVGGALRLAARHAREGDLVDAQCVAIDPPEPIVQPETTARPQVTEL